MNILKKCLKVIIAGIVSIMIINLLLCLYEIVPIHIENSKGNTDYVWEPNSVWINATEGLSFGKYDANGYNNISVVDNPDIIVLGSSHMEGNQVMQDENAAYLLSEKLKDKYSVYNMSIAGHNFYKVCQYLPANLELYENAPKAVIIETDIVDLTQEKVDQVLSSSVKRTQSYSTGIISKLQKIPFVRDLYFQLEEGLFDLFMSGNSSASISDETDSYSEMQVEEDAYEELFSYLSKLEQQYKTQIIICYHPTGELEEDGFISFNSDGYLKAFSDYADKYDISFIDMTDSFEEMYYKDNEVAHGFCTGELETGHLNKYGHAALADEIYNKIIELEENRELCQ